MYEKCSLDRWNIKLSFFLVHLWGNFLRSSKHEAMLKSEQNIDLMEKVQLNLKIVGSSRRVLWQERFTLQTTQLLHVPNVISLSVVIRAATLITKHYWPINLWIYASVRRWEGGNLITIRASFGWGLNRRANNDPRFTAVVLTWHGNIMSNFM